MRVAPSGVEVGVLSAGSIGEAVAEAGAAAPACAAADGESEAAAAAAASGEETGAGTTTTKETLALAAAGQVDLGLIYAPADESAVHSIPLFDAEVVCVVRRDNPLAQRKSVSPEDLLGHSVITNVRNQPLHDLVGQAFGEHGLDRQVMIGTNNTVTACALVRSGGGVAIVEPMGVPELFPELILLPMSPPIALAPRLVHSRMTQPSRVARRFLRALNDVLEIERNKQAEFLG